MFHIMLILLPIVFIVVIGAMMLFGFTSILAGILGGASAALLIKHKPIKRLVLIGFGIVLLVGFLCLTPFAGFISAALIPLRAIIAISILALIAILAIAGITTANDIRNKSGKTILILLFGLIGAAAAAVFLVIVSFWLG